MHTRKCSWISILPDNSLIFFTQALGILLFGKIFMTSGSDVSIRNDQRVFFKLKHCKCKTFLLNLKHCKCTAFLKLKLCKCEIFLEAKFSPRRRWKDLGESERSLLQVLWAKYLNYFFVKIMKQHWKQFPDLALMNDFFIMLLLLPFYINRWHCCKIL